MTFRTRTVLWFIVLLGLSSEVFAQGTPPMPRPVKKGRKYTVRIDSSPQQAAIYLDDKQYGIVGYTPYTGKLVKGDYKLIVELQGYKAAERIIRVEAKSKAFFVPLEKEVRPGLIDVQASADQNVLGAQVFVDGQPQGTAPAVVDASQGRHLVELRKAGFEDYSQWVATKEGERVTLTPVLKAKVVAPSKGSLLVDADVPDAEVSVDGKAYDDKTPTLIENLEEGPHVVEVRKAPAVPWKQTVYVKAGQRTKVTAELAAAISQKQGGNVRVLANIDGADVWLDGMLKGKAPLDLNNIPPGVHLIEVRAKGYTTKEERVTVNAGSAAIVKLDLEKGSAKGGTVKVVSPIPGAHVFIDGADVGAVPVEKEVAVGEHFVVVEQKGYAKYETRVSVTAGQTLPVTADLKAVGAVRFLANVEGADVVLDGEVVGKTPFVKEDVPVGDHIITVRASGYHDYEMPLKVEGGKLGIVNAELRIIDTSLSADDVARIRRGLTSWGARTMPPGRFSADIAAGYPYWLEGRATVGVIDTPALGWDISVGMRSLLTTWEFIGTLRLRVFQQGPFAAAVYSNIGGGGGFNGRNEFTWQGGGVASITFQNLVTVSGRAYFDLWSDRLCAAPDRRTDRDGNGIPDDGPTICTDNYEGDVMRQAADWQRASLVLDKDVNGPEDVLARDNGVRLFLSFIFEAAIHPQVGFFFVFEGAPFQGERASHIDLFNTQMLEEDPIYAGKLGLTFKF